MAYLFALYDTEAEQWSNPFVAQNVKIAARAIRQTFSGLPDDISLAYSLHNLGVYNADDAHNPFVPHSKPVLVMSGKGIYSFIQDGVYEQ